MENLCGDGTGNWVKAASKKLELSNIPLQMKMTYLRFLSLKQLGLAISGDVPVKSLHLLLLKLSRREVLRRVPTIIRVLIVIIPGETVLFRLLQMNHHREEMLHCEVWYLAVKGLGQSCQPGSKLSMLLLMKRRSYSCSSIRNPL